MRPPTSNFVWILLGFALAGGAGLPGRLRAADPPSLGRVVVMPPYFVEEANGPKWLYVKVDGIEVISRANESDTKDFIWHYLHQMALVEKLVPPALQLRQDVPSALILITPEMERKMSAELVADMHNVQSLHQLVLHGKSSESTSALFTVSDGGYSHIALTLSRMAFVLNARYPPLPLWYRLEALRVYERTDWVDGWETMVPAIVWVSTANPLALRKSPPPVSALLALGDLFGRPPGVDETSARAELWNCQLSLFFRWAMDGRREALWKFVNLASTEPVTESGFANCFGLSFDQARAALAAYLPRALSTPIVLVKDRDVAVPAFELRDATDEEVARIQGDLARKEIQYVRDKYPSALADYIGHASQVLVKAYARGAGSPEFLAVLGLYYADTEQDGRALPFLEQATAAGVARTSAFTELARIRCEQAIAGAGPGRLLSVRQVAAVLSPLEACPRAFERLQTYEVVASVLDHAAVPTAQQLQYLEQGLRAFPANVGLILTSARLSVRAGQKDRAFALIDRGMELMPKGATRQSFLDLQAQLTGAPP